MEKNATRTECDLLGERKVPEDAYYGVQTVRAMENFHISGSLLSNYPNFIKGMAITKKAAAIANMKVATISREQGEAIVWACDELLAGRHHDQFPIDMIQGGAGTSTNMAANEVIANLALEHMGHGTVPGVIPNRADARRIAISHLDSHNAGECRPDGIIPVKCILPNRRKTLGQRHGCQCQAVVEHEVAYVSDTIREYRLLERFAV